MATKKHEYEWVLGTVYKTKGPCYRKPGAMMLFNSFGQQFGMLSGGCLESDIQKHARNCMETGKAKTLCYDANDEDDLAFQLGIGCGGIVYILLQPISEIKQFLHLDIILEHLESRRAVKFSQRIPSINGEVETFIEECSVLKSSNFNKLKTQLKVENETTWLQTEIIPEPHLLILGGGVDAQPLVELTHQLGWLTSLWDPRPANARQEYFMKADWILRCPAAELSNFVVEKNVNAAILMTHNIKLDAISLKAVNKENLTYLALLGPQNRRAQVLQEAKLTETELNPFLAGPAGLDIGAELPEGIALSILAECHACLMGGSAHSLSGVIQKLSE